MPTFHIKRNPDAAIKIDQKKVKVVMGGQVIEPAKAEGPVTVDAVTEEPQRKGKK